MVGWALGKENELGVRWGNAGISARSTANDIFSGGRRLRSPLYLKASYIMLLFAVTNIHIPMSSCFPSRDSGDSGHIIPPTAHCSR